MRRIFFKKLITCFALLPIFISCKTDKVNINSIDETNLMVESILKSMTLEEKIGQMTQINLTVITKGPNKWSSTFPMEVDIERAKRAIVDYKVGSVLNTINNTAQTPKVWFSTISDIQKFAMVSRGEATNKHIKTTPNFIFTSKLDLTFT